MMALPFIIILIAVAIWYLSTIVFGAKIGSVATKLQEEFKDELVEEENKNTQTEEI